MCVCGGVLYTYRYSHHQNDCCTKMGSDESHFSVSLIVRDSPQTTAFEEKGLEEKRKGWRNKVITFKTACPRGSECRR